MYPKQVNKQGSAVRAGVRTVWLVPLTIGALAALAAPSFAAPPVVKTPLFIATNPSIPYDTISGRTITLKGTSDIDAAGITFSWDPGDGGASTTGTVSGNPPYSGPPIPVPLRYELGDHDAPAHGVQPAAGCGGEGDPGPGRDWTDDHLRLLAVVSTGSKLGSRRPTVPMWSGTAGPSDTLVWDRTPTAVGESLAARTAA